jgi:hypothetical protein
MICECLVVRDMFLVQSSPLWIYMPGQEVSLATYKARDMLLFIYLNLILFFGVFNNAFNSCKV